MVPRTYIFTGATGFLGSSLVNHLARYHIAALVRPDTDLTQIPDHVIQVEIANFESRLSTIGSLERTVLIHCAAYAGRDDMPETVAKEIEANYAQPMALCEIAFTNGLRNIMNFGSFWEHNSYGTLAPFNRYALLKTSFQSYLDFAAQHFGVNATTLKLCETYGPGDRRTKLLSLLLNAAHSGTAVDLTDGLQKTSFLYITDICQAVEMVLDRVDEELAAEPEHRSYHLNSGHLLSIRSFADTLASVLPTGRKLKLNWGALPKRPGLPEQAYIDGPKLLYWEPRVSLRHGLAECVRAANL